MENNINWYSSSPPSTIDLKVSIGSDDLFNIERKNSYLTVDADGVTIFQTDITTYMEAFNANISYNIRKDQLFIAAIRNFIRKMNISELNESLSNGDISETDYDAEIDKNEDKFVITLKDINSLDEVQLIADLVDKIGYDLRNFSTSEIAEMFSVKEHQLIQKVNLLPPFLKVNA